MTDKHGINDPENQYPYINKRLTDSLPCSDHERRMGAIETKAVLTEQAVMSLKATNEGLTTKMDLLLAQMTKVALLEERNVTQQVDITRAHKNIEDLEDKHDALAVEIRAFMNFSKGQGKVMWAIGAAVFALVIKALFFAANHGMTP